ncbi:uncharacterized protein CCDC197 isoform X4 [Narcine bancroftii]|uniref:uncharacterized protein CCDC197 isoform X4 n=1 Tax=Narcine bancroftii TaxID=1343680 RepID=UPI003831E99A
MNADANNTLSCLAEVRRQPLHINKIFVTQLGDRREDDEDVNYIPVIKEPIAEILTNDHKTHQSTLVLKKEVEVDQVDAELAVKREEFLQRMEAITQQRAEFERKELVNRERVLKFDKFIKDNETKRCRAIQKQQLEAKENEVKQRELQNLLHQFEEVKSRKWKIQRKMSNYKVYEDYLLEVINNLPEHYLEHGVESLAMCIIQKYETLQSTNETLINNLSRLSNELEEQQRHLEALHQEYDTSKLSEEVSSLLLAINNLADQCYVKQYGILEEMGILTKLDMVKVRIFEFIMEKKNITQTAILFESTAFTGTSDQTQNKLGIIKQMKPQTNASLVNSNKIIAHQKNRKRPTNSNAR